MSKSTLQLFSLIQLLEYRTRTQNLSCVSRKRLDDVIDDRLESTGIFSVSDRLAAAGIFVAFAPTGSKVILSNTPTPS